MSDRGLSEIDGHVATRLRAARNLAQLTQEQAGAPELKIALDAIRETNETLLAIGVSPISTHGFVMLEHSLQTAHDARRRS